MRQLRGGGTVMRSAPLKRKTPLRGRGTRTRRCENCGEEFMAEPWQIAKGQARYCSRECGYAVMRRQPKKVVECATCGKALTVPPSVARTKRYCSRACASAASRARVRTTGRSLGRKAWSADRPRVCEVCGARRVTHGHHVIYEAEVARHRPTERHDLRNRLVVCVPCHGSHHKRTKPIHLNNLPDSVFQYGAELLGPGRAYEYLRRRYDGADPRLDALLAEHEAA